MGERFAFVVKGVVCKGVVWVPWCFGLPVCVLTIGAGRTAKVGAREHGIVRNMDGFGIEGNATI